MVARQVHRAARDHESLVNEVQNAPRQTGREIGPKIKRAVLLDPPGEINARIFFRRGELDVRIGLVVAQQNVEFRVIALDEIIFKRQRLALVVHHDRFQVGDLAG